MLKEISPALDCWFLTGATAVGKSTFGLALAQVLDAEIVSLDSMAIYRGMDIGTAKPTPAQREQVPHHLIDIVEPEEEFSIERYLDVAHEAIADIRGRGKEVLFVGGTPLYLKALLRGLVAGPPADWEMREAIREEVEEVGSVALHQRLEQLDPVAAATIHPHDTRRLIRALEVFRITGQPMSHYQMQFDESHTADQCKVFVLQRSREQQHRRIEARVDEMIARGLVDEVRQLTEGGNRLGRTASQAVGYREILEHLEGAPLDLAVRKIKTRTRRFAKRQGTWFRSLSECRFVELPDDEDPQKLAESLASQINE